MKQPRVAEHGDHGPDVLAYKLTLRQQHSMDAQQRISNTFGDKMRSGVLHFQESHQLKPTGKVNAATFDALEPLFTDYSRHLVKKYARAHEPDRTFILPIAHHEPARPGQFSVGHMDPVRAVIHDTESHDVDRSIADLVGVIEFWKRNPYPSGSLNGAHYLTDRDGFIAQIGTLADVLQHTGGANTGSVGIENVAFARFTPAMWLARRAQLDALAKILAYLNHSHGIPLEKSASRGVSTHAMQSRIHPESMGHTDPGVGFPFKHVMNTARGYAAAGGWIDRN